MGKNLESLTVEETFLKARRKNLENNLRRIQKEKEMARWQKWSDQLNPYF